MPKIAKRFLPIVSLLLFVVSVLLLQRIFDVDRVCVQWSGIKQVQYGNEIIPSCDSIDRLHSHHASEVARAWVDRLNKLARLNWLTEAYKPVAVIITESDQVSEGSVAIHSSLANKMGHFERTVLLSWIQRNWPEQDELTHEVMADLLTWSMLGDGLWTDPTTAQSVPLRERLRFTLMPRMFSHYCESPFRSAAHFEACEELSDEEDEPAAQLGLRPLISWTLWNYVRDLPASQQIQFFRSLVTNHSVDAATPPENDLQAWTRNAIDHYLRHWPTGADVQVTAMKRALFHSELNEPVTFDIVVQGADRRLDSTMIASLTEWLRKTKKRSVLFVGNDQAFILPDKLPVDLEKNEIHAHQYVLVACEWPKIKNVLQLKSRLFYALKVCDEAKVPDWRQVFKDVSPSVKVSM